MKIGHCGTRCLELGATVSHVEEPLALLQAPSRELYRL